jgi:hypothetical protein
VLTKVLDESVFTAIDWDVAALANKLVGFNNTNVPVAIRTISAVAIERCILCFIFLSSCLSPKTVRCCCCCRVWDFLGFLARSLECFLILCWIEKTLFSQFFAGLFFSLIPSVYCRVT